MKKIYSKLIESLRTPAKPSEFISSIDQLEPGPVVAYARESTLTQKGNLPPQRSNLETQLQKRGFPVVAVIEEIASGCEEGRIGFERAILEAKSAEAFVAAETVDRFRRSWPHRNALLSISSKVAF